MLFALFLSCMKCNSLDPLTHTCVEGSHAQDGNRGADCQMERTEHDCEEGAGQATTATVEDGNEDLWKTRSNDHCTLSKEPTHIPLTENQRSTTAPPRTKTTNTTDYNIPRRHSPPGCGARCRSIRDKLHTCSVHYMSHGIGRARDAACVQAGFI